MCWWPASQPAVIWCWIAHDNSPPLNVHFAYRGLAGLGLGLATLALAQSASAADITTDVQKAVTSVSRDNRVLIIATVLLPVAGWVLFNISGPALNQINNMSNKQKNIARRARGVAGRAFMSRVCILHKRSLSDQIRSGQAVMLLACCMRVHQSGQLQHAVWALLVGWASPAFLLRKTVVCHFNAAIHLPR